MEAVFKQLAAAPAGKAGLMCALPDKAGIAGRLRMVFSRMMGPLVRPKRGISKDDQGLSGLLSLCMLTGAARGKSRQCTRWYVTRTVGHASTTYSGTTGARTCLRRCAIH